MLPRAGCHPRWANLIGGGIVFVWLTTEDNQVAPATILGLVLAVLATASVSPKRLTAPTLSARDLLLVGVIAGAVIGLGTSIATAGLMFLKNALHAHVFLDFPPGVMLAILERAPAWTLVGALAGLGLASGWLALQRNHHETEL